LSAARVLAVLMSVSVLVIMRVVVLMVVLVIVLVALLMVVLVVVLLGLGVLMTLGARCQGSMSACFRNGSPKDRCHAALHGLLAQRPRHGVRRGLLYLIVRRRRRVRGCWTRQAATDAPPHVPQHVRLKREPGGWRVWL
jgi:hypothetical protein